MKNIILTLAIAALAVSACNEAVEKHPATIYAPTDKNTADVTVPSNEGTNYDYAYPIATDATEKNTPQATPVKTTTGEIREYLLCDGIETSTVSTTEVDFSEIFHLENMKPQVFTIDNSKGQVITGTKGIKVFFPANCFNLTNTDKLVTIELKEYADVTDMFFAGMSTASNGNLIETAGTVHIKALEGSNEVQLKKGSQIQLAFPKNGEDMEGMQTFYGEAATTVAAKTDIKPSQVNWQAGPNLVRVNTAWQTLVTDTSSIPSKQILQGANFKVTSDITQNLPTKIGFRGYNNIMEYMEDHFYVEDGIAAKLAGLNATVRYKVGRNGKPYNISMRCGKNFTARKLNKNQEMALKRLKRQVKTFLYFIPPATTNEHGGLGRDYFTLNLQRPSKKPQDRNLYTESIPSYTTSVIPTGFAMVNVDSLRANSADYYLLNSTNLGYINCDRFPTLTQTRDLIVKLPSKPNRKVNVVFTTLKGLMAAAPISNGYKVASVPANRKIKVVVTEVRDGKSYFAVKVANTSDRIKDDFEFKPYTEDAMKEALALK